MHLLKLPKHIVVSCLAVVLFLLMNAVPSLAVVYQVHCVNGSAWITTGPGYYVGPYTGSRPCVSGTDWVMNLEVRQSMPDGTGLPVLLPAQDPFWQGQSVEYWIKAMTCYVEVESGFEPSDEYPDDWEDWPTIVMDTDPFTWIEIE